MGESMKLIVFSDSHGTMEYMRAAVQKERPDYILHLGDHDRDAQRLSLDFPTIPLLAVRGNCDPGSDTPEKRVLTLDNQRFYMCHGHRLGVKSGLLRAVLAAQEAQADFLLFGHTHMPYYEQTAGLRILNPGACGNGGRSYGLIILGKGTVDVSVEKIDTGGERP